MKTITLECLLTFDVPDDYEASYEETVEKVTAVLTEHGCEIEGSKLADWTTEDVFDDAD